MNRKERRTTSKKLGIMKYQKSLPLNKRFDLIGRNIIEGKQMHNEFVEKTKFIQDESVATKESEQMYTNAIKYMEDNKISFIDALEIVKKMESKNKS